MERHSPFGEFIYETTIFQVTWYRESTLQRENSVTRTLHENQILRFPERFVLVPTILCIMSQGFEAAFLYMMVWPLTDSRNLKGSGNKHDV
jgi:hypothetical protein